MSVLRYEPLPGQLFLVRVPIVATYTDEEISLLGLPINVDHGFDYGSTGGRYDYNAYKELTTVMLPLTKIVDIYCSGHKIAVVNQSDIPIIYEILEKYLMGVTTVKNYSLNHAMIQEDRLDDIERFAQEMFGLNKGVIAKSVYEQMSKNSFDLSAGFMTPHEAFEAKQRANQVKPTSSPMQFTAKKPGTQLGYPYKPEPVSTPTNSVLPSTTTEVKHVSPEDLYGGQPTVDNISYLYNAFPTFDINKVERKSTYRKTFTIT